jgi:predicted O-methyltransferase YrrM
MTHAEIPDPIHEHPVVPERIAVRKANRRTLRFLRTTSCRTIAEVGIFKGYTSTEIAKHLDGHGELHLFDFSDRVEAVVSELHAAGYHNVIGHGNSRKLLDSYNWSLMHVLRQHETPVFDYVFLDGAHTWGIDALAFLLIDRLLRVDGYIDFDDYEWSLKRSPSQNPDVFPLTAELYTDEQIRERQVALVVDLLVKRDPRYVEVVNNKVFRKIM